MGEKRAYKVRKPGGDRKKLKQEQEGLKVGIRLMVEVLAVCDTQWGRWSDSLHGISFFKKRCMVKKK